MEDSNVNKVPAKIGGYIKSIIDKAEYITYDVHIKNFSLDEGNMGKLYAVVVDGKTIDSDKNINIFIKQIIDNKDQMKIYSVSDVYEREYFAYSELFKTFKELEAEAHIPVNERFDTAISYDESTKETIILENLAKRDFITYHRKDIVPLKYAELCMKQLAKFHSLTFVLQKKRPEFFDRIKSMKQPFNFGEDWNGFVKNMFNVTIKYLDDDVRSKVAQKISDIVDKYPLYMNNTTTVCTLCHGDYRQNNIMVKEMNGKATEVIPVDFQLLHYGSPIHDILYFIFSSTDYKFRELHMEHLKDLYYENLKAYLDYFLIDVNSVYPMKVFERDFKEKMDFGMMINVFFMPFILSADDDVPDVTEELSTISFKVDKRFKERFREIVEEFITSGYL